MYTIPGYHIIEKLYESSNSLIYRATRLTDNQPVILKMLNAISISPERVAWLQREYEIMRSLAHVNGVVAAYSLEPPNRVGTEHHPYWVMVLEDFGAQSLTQLQLAGTLTMQAFLCLAIDIVQIVGQMHTHHIIHKDINPSNIVLNPATGQVKFIDFGIATMLSSENPIFRNPRLLEGTLAYISPEQTGRMNRDIDYRSDFYSLGVTLYELLTGQLPFITEDVLELAHSHIARQPLSPIEVLQHKHHTLVDETPAAALEAISVIILKLMSKNAEDRYQSDYGIIADLEICQRLAENVQQDVFVPGRYDISDRFQIPQKLYGREGDITLLVEVFERASQGSSEMVLVTGAAGIGKSALIREIYKPMTHRRGYLVAGKFDQFQRDIPYSAIIQALQSLIHQLLTESESNIETWRRRILEAVGSNGQVIIDVIPEVELIIGPQPPVVALGPVESHNRFHLVFQQFIGIFTRPEHPLTIFLDDLQWADSASLKLLEQLLLTSSGTRGKTRDDSSGSESAGRALFVIGAYREAEVEATHGLQMLLDAIAEAGIIVHTLSLTPLDVDDVTLLVAETMHCHARKAKPLARLLVAKTGGNPFFLNEFLKALYADGLIWFERDIGAETADTSMLNFSAPGWRWDMEQIQAQEVTDNVVDLMISRLQRLAEQTQMLLQIASCIGNQFDLATLASVTDMSTEMVATHLWEAITKSLILPIGDAYKLVGTTLKLVYSQGAEWDEPQNQHDYVAEYKFAHDRIQQAAYVLMPEKERQLMHWHIGNVLLTQTLKHTYTKGLSGCQNLSQSEGLNVCLGEHIFDVVNHLNEGLYGLDPHDATYPDREELQTLAMLSMVAGKRAKGSAAYGPAFHYLQAGVDILCLSQEKAHIWQQQYALTLELFTEAAEAAYLSGDFETMGHLAQEVLNNAQTLLDKGRIYEVKVHAFQAQNRPLEAIQTARDMLALLGIYFPEEPGEADVVQGLQETFALLGDERIERFSDLSAMSDPSMLMAMSIMGHITAPAYQAFPQLLPLIVFRMVSLSITYGNAGESPFVYALCGLILAGVVGDIERGSQFGNLALRLLETTDSLQCAARTRHVVTCNIRHWKEHIQHTLKPLLDAYQEGLETGDLGFAALAIMCYCFHSYFSGKELNWLNQEMQRYGEALAKMKQIPVLHFHQIYHQSVLNLLGESDKPHELRGSVYDEVVMLPRHEAAQARTALFVTHLNKLVLCYLFGHYEEAIAAATQARTYQDGAGGLLLIPVFHFYDSLTRLALVRAHMRKAQDAHKEYEATEQSNTIPAEVRDLLEQVEANQKKLCHWGQQAPMNYLHKYYLVEAERARVAGNDGEAREYYDKGIVLAQEHGYINDEALGNEIAATFYLDKGLPHFAAVCMRQAHNCYLHWGAEAKLQDLEQRYGPVLAQTTTHVIGEMVSKRQTRVGQSITSALDLPSVIKASQTISSEIVLESLLSKMMRIVIEHAGAQRGVLILNTSGTWTIQAEGTVENPDVTVLQAVTVEEGKTQSLPLSIINYVSHTRQNMLLHDARHHEQFSQDPYIKQYQPKSILCMALINQGKLMGMLYLENTVTSNVFTTDRLEVLNLFSNQIAVAIENATLYSSLEDAVAERTAELSHTNKVLQAEVAERKRIDGELRTAYQSLKSLTERLQQELNLAKRIQRSLLPSEKPHWVGLDVVCYSKPAHDVGGDWYAYQAFAHPTKQQPLGHYGFAVGDVSGKGMPAALLMAVSLTSFHAVVGQKLTPGALLAYLDDALVHYTHTTHQNCALVYMELGAIVDCGDNTDEAGNNVCIMRVANAGCVTPIIKRIDGTVEWVDVGGMPLGVGMGTTFGYEELVVGLSVGDIIILTSDGVVEAGNAQGELFSFDRLEDAVRSGPSTSAEAMMMHLWAQVDDFVGTMEPHDDVTLVVVKV